MLWLFCACCPCWAHGKHSYTIYTDKIWEYTPKSVTWVWKALNQLARSYFLSSMTLHARVIFWSTEFHKLQEIHVRWVAQAKTPHHQLESAHLHEWGKRSTDLFSLVSEGLPQGPSCVLPGLKMSVQQAVSGHRPEGRLGWGLDFCQVSSVNLKVFSQTAWSYVPEPSALRNSSPQWSRLGRRLAGREATGFSDPISLGGLKQLVLVV